MEYLLNLGEFAGGALQEKAEEAMRKVIGNMRDPNTPWKKQRQIVIKISFAQNEDRDDAEVSVSVDTKLAPVSPVGTRMSIGVDLRDGKAYVQEYGKQVRGQMSFDDLTPPLRQEAADGGAPAAGEEKAAVNNDVIDFRKAVM